MRPINTQRTDTIALTKCNPSRPNRLDAYTRHPFFMNRFTYKVEQDRITFEHCTIGSRKFLIDSAKALKGDISAKGWAAGEYILHKSENNTLVIFK